MTAVKENLLTMVPQMPQMITDMAEEEAAIVYNIFLTYEPKKKHAEIPFDPKYTEENRSERMARAFALSENIEIDEEAIRDLREASMI